MADVRPKTVDEYLARVQPRFRAALEKLRKQIRAVVPEATEGLAWGMPSFRLRVWLVCYAAFKDHCSFFPMSADVVRKYSRLLKGFKTTKGTIHFTPEKPLPASLVKTLVNARVAEVKAGRTDRR
ncbi:DUF1801 domain-containing protein [candidate division WOR-3 bacterium]|nr:DUF1801 domain-containing protein [candidate division WOR-3 bacterium]